MKYWTVLWFSATSNDICYLIMSFFKYTLAFKCNEVKSMARAAQATYEQQLIDKYRANPKALYEYMIDKSKL